MWVSGLRESQSLQGQKPKPPDGLLFGELGAWAAGAGARVGIRRGPGGEQARRRHLPVATGHCGYPDVVAETLARGKLTSFAIKS